MPLSFMKDSVTVIRAKMITKNGAQVRDWANATEHTVDNTYFSRSMGSAAVFRALSC